MQINIGLKIKELRKRDGRTQEAMAAALGVTGQAISRWEANGGYPDMEIIPSIANYFHVTIDELFGYSEDRTKKIESIFTKADAALNAQEDMTECVDMLRSAVEEFPSEIDLQIKLGYALIQYGWQKYGARSYTIDGSNYVHEDTKYNSQNIYWHEALQIFEKVIETDISGDDRDSIISIMVMTYQNMGHTEKAISLSEKQNSLHMSKELLLPQATTDELRDKYQGEAIIALLIELNRIITSSVQTKVHYVSSGNDGINSLITFANFCESIFSDGNCGALHYHLCALYLHAALYAVTYRNDHSLALMYFEKGFDHKKKGDALKGVKEYHYTAPLVSEATGSNHVSSLTPNFWEIWRKILPNEFWENIKQVNKYSECFK